jgi:hypothetical protein
MSKVIRVQFSQAQGSEMPVNESRRQLSPREYDYFLIPDDVEVRKGSLAVVDVSGILRIVQINAVVARSQKATKYAIAVFNLDEYKEKLEKIQDIQSLKAAITERAEDARQRAYLQGLAETDPQLKTMLDELKALEGNV